MPVALPQRTTRGRVADRLYIDLREFDAPGDGTNDDTAGFQAALDQAKSEVVPLVIPDAPTSWNVSNLELDYSGDTQAATGAPYGFAVPPVRGANRRGVVVNQVSGSSGPILSLSGVQGSGAGGANNRKLSGFLIEGLEFVGTSGAGNHGIQFRNFNSGVIRDVHIRGCGGSGIKLVRDYFKTGTEEYAHNLHIDNVVAIACSRYGIEGSATAWPGGTGSGTGAAALSFLATSVEASANTLGGFYINPANVSMVDCRAFQNGGPGFTTFRNPNQDSSNFAFNLYGCRSEGNCTSTGSYEIKIDGGCSGSLIAATTVLATHANGPHCIGVGTAAAGSDSYIQRMSLVGGFYAGNGSTAGQKFLVTGTDSRGLHIVNPRIEFSRFAGSPTVAGDVITDGGVNTTMDDTAVGGFTSGGWVALRREIATPSSANTNSARLYIKDNGSGKTQLAVIFSSGAEQVLATQP